MHNLRDDSKFINVGAIESSSIAPDVMPIGSIRFGPTHTQANPFHVSNPMLPGHLQSSGLPSPMFPGDIYGPQLTVTPAIQKQLDDLDKKRNSPEEKKHSHYFKDVSKLQTIDVYRVLELFGVTDQALGHAIKKLLVAGGRGAGKSIEKDIQEAVDTLQRLLEMKRELPSV